MNKPLSIEDWTVVSVGQTQTIGSKGFQKRELVITDSGDKYPQFRMIEATQDKCADLDNIVKGDKVTVDFWASGRAWTNPEGVVKYFNSDKLASIKKTAHDWDTTNQVDASIDMISGTEGSYQKNRPKVGDDDLPF
jgi:hypothetical protein